MSSIIPLTLEFLEKIVLIQPIVYPVDLLVGFLLDSADYGASFIFGKVLEEISGNPNFGLFLVFFFLPNFLTVPLMALEIYGLPEIAKKDQIVQVVDQMFSLVLMIFPLVQLGFTLVCYEGGLLDSLFRYSFGSYYFPKTHVLSSTAMVYLMAIDFIAPTLHAVKVFTYAYL